MRGRVNRLVLGLANLIRYKSFIIPCDFARDVFQSSPASLDTSRSNVLRLCFLGALLYFPALGARDFWAPVEPRYVRRRQASLQTRPESILPADIR